MKLRSSIDAKEYAFTGCTRDEFFALVRLVTEEESDLEYVGTINGKRVRVTTKEVINERHGDNTGTVL
jgi:hypothetical protein